jgi:hypothetical protein
MRRPRRESLHAPESLEVILERAGESRFARVRPPMAARVWREAVGARIADRAKPVSLWDGVLVLRVPSSVWAHELSLLADEVCARLRERGVEARELRFRVGALPAVDRPPERRVARAVPASFPVPPELAHTLDGVADDALRAAIARAAEANLAWQSATRPAPPDTPVTEARRAARAPRASAGGTAPPAPATPASRADAPRTPSGGRGRSR